MRNGMEEATSCGSGRAEDSVRMRLLGPSQDGSGRKTAARDRCSPELGVVTDQQWRSRCGDAHSRVDTYAATSS
ncbi:hypothetical protein M8818_002018 [Zalaria obscura]|uniref:Uncharacterized protein n=1 Tax=Zalaria obscura TaxID=2024903 RepID=A0ACC3SIQ1_9PEZI